MQLRYLPQFIAVAETLNVTRAAEILRMTQPSLTVQIKKLEQDIGVALFERVGRGIKLTEAGQVFLDKAREVLALAQRSVALTQQTAQAHGGHLRIGHNHAAEFHVFPRVVPAFRERYPDIQLSFHRAYGTGLLDALGAGRIDLGFAWFQQPIAGLDIVPLAHEALVVALPQGHRLAARETITIAALSGEKLVVVPRAIEPMLYAAIETLFAQAGATLSVAMEVDTLISLLNFVALGSGCALVADFCRNIPWAGVVYRAIEPAPLLNALTMVKRADGGAPAQLFYRFALECLGKSQDGAVRQPRRQKTIISP
jgi:DNA-binding transcriptional LysR family regulator